MGVPEGVPEERCGFTLEPEDLPTARFGEAIEVDGEDFRKRFSITCCNRRVWDERDRCIWHANVKEKPVRELVAAKSGEPERLDGAFLIGVNLENSLSFEGHRLLGARLSDASLYKVDLSGADLLWADLSNAILREADLSDADLLWTDLSDADLQETDLSNTDLLWADLSNANLLWADLLNTDFQGAILFKANLGGATIEQTNFRATTLAQADFEGIKLNIANFRSAYLSEAKLHNAHFQGVRIDDDTTFGEKNQQYRSAYELDADRTVATKLDNEASKGDESENDSKFRVSTRSLLNALNRWFFWPRANPHLNEEAIENLEKSIWSYRTYQRLLREHALPDKVPRYYVREKHARRKLALAENNYLEWLKLSLARWTMLYGESAWRVVGTSVVVIAIWTVLYLFAGGIEETVNSPNSITHDISLPIGPLVTSPPELATTIFANLYFSVVTFTTLGYGDVQPASGAVQLLAGIQSLLGAALIALLVAVLSRRVMR